jgi:dsRNA-specific ribonuclease
MNTSSNNRDGAVAGSDDEFVDFIRDRVLKEAALSEAILSSCLTSENIDTFRQAFTSPSVNKNANYELLEQLGDVTINKFIVQYMYDSFPQLQTAEGVNVVARLKIYYGGKKIIQQFADRLDVWRFVNSSEDEKTKRKKIIVEDVFEALVGALEFAVGRAAEKMYGTACGASVACGYSAAFSFLKAMYASVPIAICYETLVDPKTRLKELFDEHRRDFGTLDYLDTKDPETAEYRTDILRKGVLIGSARSIVKKDSHELASERALQTLRSDGIVKHVPNHYRHFQKNHFCSGVRGAARNDLAAFVVKILHFSSLPEKWVKRCVEPDAMIMFSNAVTSKSVDPRCNYEFFEQLGDASINKFIVQYMYKRYPHLKVSWGVNVVARLKIKYGSKGQLYQIAEELSFWRQIRASDDERNKRKKSLLEDVFEAFIGCVEFVLDKCVRADTKQKCFGFGFFYVFEILASIFDKIDIPFAYEKLVDSKTRLKELFDENRSVLGSLSYDDFRCRETGMYISKAKNGDSVVGTGSSTLKKDAQEKASQCALRMLARRGFVKSVPPQYFGEPSVNLL